MGNVVITEWEGEEVSIPTEAIRGRYGRERLMRLVPGLKNKPSRRLGAAIKAGELDHLIGVQHEAPVRPRAVYVEPEPEPESYAPEPPRADVYGVTSAREIDVREIRQRAAAMFKRTNKKAEKQQAQRIAFDRGPIMLAFVGDQHFGNAGTDVERAYSERDMVLRTPGAFFWMMGDIVDNYIVSKLLGANMQPSLEIQGQWDLARDYLQGCGDRLVAVNSGNHATWTHMLSGLDYDADITPSGPIYDRDEIQAEVRVGRQVYRVMARHKWQGSSIYNITHGQERACKFAHPDFHLYVGAHIHRGAVYREFIHDGTRRAAVQVGTYKLHDTYARREGFTPNDHSTACCVILDEFGGMFGGASLESMCDYMRRVYPAAA